MKSLTGFVKTFAWVLGIVVIGSFLLTAYSIIGRSYTVAQMPEDFAAALGKYCDHRDIQSDILVNVRDPRRVGKRRYEYTGSGSKSASPKPIVGIPIERQKVLDIQPVECVLLIRTESQWILPIVLRPSYQMGMSGPYVDRMDHVSTLMKQYYPEVILKRPQTKVNEKLYAAIRCRDDDPEWRLLGPITENEKSVDVLDIRTCPSVASNEDALEISRLIELASVAIYENELD